MPKTKLLRDSWYCCNFMIIFLHEDTNFVQQLNMVKLGKMCYTCGEAHSIPSLFSHFTFFSIPILSRKCYLSQMTWQHLIGQNIISCGPLLCQWPILSCHLFCHITNFVISSRAQKSGFYVLDSCSQIYLV